MASELALLEVGILFTTVAIAGVIATRLNQSVIPLYIIVGMILNPYVLGRAGGYALEETEFVEIGAELGIVFLLFFLGLEFNLERLLESKDRITKAGTIDLAINFGAGFILGYALFRSLLPAFLVAGIIYISSSAIITKSLIDLGWIANDESNPMLGTLVYEDLVIAVYLVIASALVLGGGDASDAVRSIGTSIAFIIALGLAVQYGTDFFQRALETGSNEFLVLRTVSITVLIAGIGLALGVSEAVAAFFVGMAFSSTEHVHDIEQLLEPVRDIFAAIFFFWIGVITDPLLFTGVIGLIVLAVLLTTPTKFISGYLSGRVYELDTRRSTRVGLGMTIRGEFSLIIATLALSGAGATIPDGVAQTIYSFSVGYVLIMSILGTTLMQYSDTVESLLLPYLETRTGTPTPSD